MAKRTAIYCRLSREESGEEAESIRNQKAFLKEYAEKSGWEVCGVFADQDFSGADPERPEFQKMLTAARAGAFDIILTKTLSRFARDSILLERYLQELFPLWGVRFVAVLDHVDTLERSGRKARQITGLVGQWYLEDLSENVRQVLESMRVQGLYTGGFPLYGYRRELQDKHRLEIDPEAAEIVRFLFRETISGRKAAELARELREKGVLCPSEYKKMRGLTYRNGRAGNAPDWSAAQIRRILREQMYTGDMIQGRRRKASWRSKEMVERLPEQWVVVPNRHPAIISREVFEQAERLLEEGHSFLRGKLFCGLCGRPLRVGGRKYFRCAGKTEGSGCPGVSANRESLEQAVSKELELLLGQELSWGQKKKAASLLLREIRLSAEGELLLYWDF